MRARVVALGVLLALSGCIGARDTGMNAQPSGSADLFSGTSVFPGKYDTTMFYSRPLARGAYAILPGEVASLESDVDGVTIQVGVLRPDVPAGVKVPVIAWASPYHPPFEDPNRHALGEAGTANLNEIDPWLLTERFVPHGYAVALVAVRGTSSSGGCMEYFGPNEVSDLDQAVRWLGEQPWSNGRVGMFGASYDGATQWGVASRGNPYLKTIVPVSGVNDFFDLLFRNGTSQWRGATHTTDYWRSSLVDEGTPYPPRSPDHYRENALCPEAADRLRLSVEAARSGERDAFWEARNARPGVESSYRGSVFLVQGLQDWNVPPSQQYAWVNELEARGVVVKHLLGQWWHWYPDLWTEVEPTGWLSLAGPYTWSHEYLKENPHMRWDFAEILLRWFDHWLKGGASVDLGPKVQVEDNEYRWRNEASWPPADARRIDLYLTADGKLAFEPGSATASFPVGASPQHLASPVQWEDANAHAACGSCATFETDPLDRDVRLAGYVDVPLTVTPRGPGGWINAYLYLEKDGKAQRIGWGSIDLRFAAGGETPAPVTPESPLLARLQLEPLDAVARAGAVLRLVVAQGSENDFHRAMTVSGAPPAPFALEVGGDKSLLRLPVIEREESAFFEPPRKV